MIKLEKIKQDLENYINNQGDKVKTRLGKLLTYATKNSTD